MVRGVRRRDPAARFITVRDLGLDGQPDTDILAHADANRLITLSHDANTTTKHAYDRLAAGQGMSGLLIVHQTDPIGPAIESLFTILGASELEDWNGAVVFLPI